MFATRRLPALIGLGLGLFAPLAGPTALAGGNFHVGFSFGYQSYPSRCYSAPVVVSRKGFHKPVFERLARVGITRARVDGAVVPTDPPPELNRYKLHDIDAVAAEAGDEIDRDRLLARLGGLLPHSSGLLRRLDEDGAVVRTFARDRLCPSCARGFRLPDPPDFATSGPGACPACRGLGARRVSRTTQ